MTIRLFYTLTNIIWDATFIIMIAILLSTFNGEKYLDELISSIQTQTNKDWELYIRDDGSTDRTLDILSNYSQQNSNIHILQDPTVHRGSAKSFMYLLNEIDADFYMFADQDDVWLPDKIELCVQKYERKWDKIPVVIHTDLKVVDTNLNVIHDSFWEYSGANRWINNNKVLPVYNFITGCTMFFNKCARDLCLKHVPQNLIMHDSYIGICTHLYGGRIYSINDQTILYRQHEANVLGAVKAKTLMNRLADLNSIFKNVVTQYKYINSIRQFSKWNFIKLKFQVLKY